MALRKGDNPTEPLIRLDTFRFEGPLAAGREYTRREQVRLPAHISLDYRFVVITDDGNRVYEHSAETNNRTADDDVLNIVIDAATGFACGVGDSASQRGPGRHAGARIRRDEPGTHRHPNTELDRQSLSLARRRTECRRRAHWHAGQSSGLGSRRELRRHHRTVVVPKRFRGAAYVLVATDIYNQVDEWPNDDNNHAATPVFVNLAPLADLVTSDVVAPQQAVGGATIEVRYTVTNRGVGETDADRWQDSIWLTRNKNRPHPGQGDILLKTLEHRAALVAGAGYDQVVTVQIPEQVESGTWYITPWTDPYDAVLEDTLATNINPDDPHEVDNNNYKARAISIISLPLPKPDLVVESVEVAPQAYGGDLYQVTWTVKNVGLGVAEPGSGWADRILLSDVPDATTSHSQVYILDWQVVHDQPLGPGASYTETRTFRLSPSAAGSFVIVITDASVNWALPPQFVVVETNEDNNQLAVASDVRPVPADLLVTQITAQPQNYSGERTSLQFTVTNVGQWPVWSGTKYWQDHIWISADQEFDANRATYLGTVLHKHEQPMQPGDSYAVNFEADLPAGLDGEYFLYVHLDAHSADGYLPVLDPVGTGWWTSEAAWQGWRDNRILRDQTLRPLGL